MCFLMIYMFNEKKKKNSILFNAPKNVQKDVTVPLTHIGYGFNTKRLMWDFILETQRLKDEAFTTKQQLHSQRPLSKTGKHTFREIITSMLSLTIRRYKSHS